jgi:hypothetical protein
MNDRVKKAFETLIDQMEEPPTWQEVSTLTARPGSARRRKPWLAAAAGIGLVILVALASVLLRPTTPPSFQELDAAVTTAIDALTTSPGVRGLQRAYVEEFEASSVWFDFRPETGDVVVIQQVDLDLTQFPWWRTESGEPQATGRSIETTALVQLDDSFYAVTRSPSEPDGVWSVREAPPRAPLAFGVLMLTTNSYGLDPTATEGDVTYRELSGGDQRWTLTTPYRDGTAIQTWEISRNGDLTMWSSELIGVTKSLDFDPGPFSSGSVSFTRVADPDPIAAPTPGTALDLSEFDVPDDGLLQD